MRLNRAIIEAAIVGFEQRKRQIDETIAELRSQLDGTTLRGRETDPAGTTTKGARRKMSAAARKRMAAAQKARWAAYHAKESAPAKKTAPKRKLSAAAKAKLAANLAKARAAKAARAKKAA